MGIRPPTASSLWEGPRAAAVRRRSPSSSRAPSPVRITRLLDWLADVRTVAPRRAAHIVVNKAPDGAFARTEIAGEITRTYLPASLHFVPHDPRVEAAAWRGELVKPGPFTKAVGPPARSPAPEAGLEAAPLARGPPGLRRLT